MTPEFAGHDRTVGAPKRPFAVQPPLGIAAFLDRAVRMRDPPGAVPAAIDMRSQIAMATITVPTPPMQTAAPWSRACPAAMCRLRRERSAPTPSAR